MSNLIVFVELHLFVRLILKSLHPCILTHSSKKKHFSRFVLRKSLMTLLSEFIMINLIDGDLLPFNIGLTT